MAGQEKSAAGSLLGFQSVLVTGAERIVRGVRCGGCFYLLEARSKPAAPMKKPPVALFSRTTAR